MSNFTDKFCVLLSLFEVEYAYILGHIDSMGWLGLYQIYLRAQIHLIMSFHVSLTAQVKFL